MRLPHFSFVRIKQTIQRKMHSTVRNVIMCVAAWEKAKVFIALDHNQITRTDSNAKMTVNWCSAHFKMVI